MRQVIMLEDHQGCRAGDTVGFQDEVEADSLVKTGKAEYPIDLVKDPEGAAEQAAKAASLRKA